MKKISLFILGLLFFSSMHVKAYNLDGSYTNLDGDEVEFSTFQGKPLLVEAFSTVCDHCLDQHPVMVELNDKYSSLLSMNSKTKFFAGQIKVPLGDIFLCNAIYDIFYFYFTL